MRHPERVEDYLEHIAMAIERATHYLADVSDVEALRHNTEKQDAIVRNLEIVGEATTQIQNMSPDFMLSHPTLP